MKQHTVILSTNDNKDYLGYLPYVQKAWNMLGWNTITLYLGEHNLPQSEYNRIVKLTPIPGIRDATVVQVARLFGHRFAEGIIMTGDVDMMPLRNYWHPNPNEITVYGADLCDYKQYPICYIAASKNIWNDLIAEESISELLETYPKAKSHDFDEWWSSDQAIITNRINKLQSLNGIFVNFKDRGMTTYRSFRHPSIKLAKGRIDRALWFRSAITPGKKIDAHLPRPFNDSVASKLLKRYFNE